MNEEKQTIVNFTVQKAKSVIISNQDDYSNAVKMLKEIKELREKLDARYKPIQQKTKEANQLALKNINDYKIPLDEANRIIRLSMGKYATEQEAKRRAEENRIRKESEEKERAAIEKDLLELGVKEDTAKEEAEKMEIVIPEIKIVDETKTSGVTYRKDWKFTIEDVSKIPRKYMMPDEERIKKVVKALKNETNIPGIKVFSNKTPITRF